MKTIKELKKGCDCHWRGNRSNGDYVFCGDNAPLCDNCSNLLYQLKDVLGLIDELHCCCIEDATSELYCEHQKVLEELKKRIKG